MPGSDACEFHFPIIKILLLLGGLEKVIRYLSVNLISPSRRTSPKLMKSAFAFQLFVARKLPKREGYDPKREVYWYGTSNNCVNGDINEKEFETLDI
jgi:hypothetical protein